jgi:hypothetical protein
MPMQTWVFDVGSSDGKTGYRLRLVIQTHGLGAVPMAGSGSGKGPLWGESDPTSLCGRRGERCAARAGQEGGKKVQLLEKSIF